MSKEITPNLWFDGNAKDAVEFYVSVFPDSKIVTTEYYPNSEDEGLADFQKELAGKVLTIEFELSGNHFVAINAGPEFKFNEAVSFSIPCEDQKEIDYYWDKLTSNGGQESKCGWLKDKYGFSWQVIPSNIGQLMTDPVKGPKAMQELLKMTKIEIEKLKNPK